MSEVYIFRTTRTMWRLTFVDCVHVVNADKLYVRPWWTHSSLEHVVDHWRSWLRRVSSSRWRCTQLQQLQEYITYSVATAAQGVEPTGAVDSHKVLHQIFVIFTLHNAKITIRNWIHIISNNILSFWGLHSPDSYRDSARGVDPLPTWETTSLRKALIIHTDYLVTVSLVYNTHCFTWHPIILSANRKSHFTCQINK